MGIGGIMGTIIDGINWNTGTFRGCQLFEPPVEPELTIETEPEPIVEPEPEIAKEIDLIEVMPWEPMPEGYQDYRPLLQRDGLFLYAWTKWEDGSIVVSWKKTSGKMRAYSSLHCREESLENIMPSKDGSHRWGSAWDYGVCPDIVVFAAPRYIDYPERDAFLARLRESGAANNFDYRFTLAKQKANITEDEAPSVVNRFLDLTARAKSNPSQAGGYIEYFISAIIADGTVDRWNREKAKKRRRV
jgi:hypothetical protein